MWIAAQMGHVGIVRELMDAGACVDTVREVRMASLYTPGASCLKINDNIS